MTHSLIRCSLGMLLLFYQAGVHSLFVASGIHASELKIRNAVSTQLAEDAVQSICDEYGVNPTYTISSFVWEVG